VSSYRIFSSKRTPRGAVALVAVLAACCAWAAPATDARGEETDDRPAGQLFDEVGISPELGAKLPLDLEFVDADGNAVRLGDCLGDRPVILHLVYYQCPMLCKLSSDGLLRALETLSLNPGRDFTILTLSFDPREGPDLSALARQVAIERCGREAVAAGWRFLTGDEAAIAKLCKAVGFRYKFDEATGQYAHASGVYILTSDGTISRYLSGVEYGPRDLRLAVVEASEGKVGTTTDQVLLLCYMYDPITGKYGLAIITAVRTAGVLTVSAMAVAIGVMLRRERQRPSGVDTRLDTN